MKDSHKLIASSAIIGLIFYSIIFRNLISENGLYIFADTVWFPDISKYAGHFTSMWAIGGGFNIDQIMKFPPIGFFIVLLFKIGAPSEVIQKIVLFVLVDLTIILTSYSLWKLLNKIGYKNMSNYAAILGAIGYLFNPIMVSIAELFYTWFGYALIPLCIYLYVNLIDEPTRKNVIFLSISLAFLVASDIHWAPFIALIFVIYLTSWSIYVRNVKIIVGLKYSVYTCFLSIILSSYWIIPSILYWTKSGPLTPTFGASLLEIEMFSLNSYLYNTIRFMGKWGISPGAWGIPNGEAIPYPAFYTIWLISTFLVVILAVFALLSHKKKDPLLITMGIAFLIGIMFASGTKFPISGISQLIMHIPNFSWIFRVPTKWLWFMAFPTTVLYTISINIILDKFANRRLLIIPIIVAILMIITLPTWQLYTGDVDNRAKPVSPPKELESVNDFLVKNAGQSNTFWIPREPMYIWNNKSTGPFYLYSSLTSAYYPNESVYVNLTENIQSFYTYEYLKKNGVKYIVYHSDGINYKNDLKQELSSTEWYTLVKVIGYYSIYIVENPLGLIYSCNKANECNQVKFKQISETEYRILDIPSDVKTIILSEKYDPMWTIKFGNSMKYSNQTEVETNIFNITTDKRNNIDIIYIPQIWFKMSSMFSIVLFVMCLIMAWRD